MLLELDEEILAAELATLKSDGVQSVAVGFLHSYIDASHEIRTRDLIEQLWPEAQVTLSSEVCPEIREYERFSTACANAYIQPLVSEYLQDLETRRRALGMRCPMLLMQSGGGLGTLEDALRFPVRLIESGPAGGALLSAELARSFSD